MAEQFRKMTRWHSPQEEMIMLELMLKAKSMPSEAKRKQQANTKTFPTEKKRPAPQG
ncbi:hypothetical protein [Geothermobacter hydrogeniphilus]|uniref:hypothetical protein n=1 Tax=Geothermobacter hydrogeniphilus TaxID=1969733 RepID=UPI001304FF63|nr:hypothetical protein [Geothermobacter hydrogeniphilus]